MGNNKSLSHEQIIALSPGPLPLLVKEIVGGLLCVIIHISLPCICLEGCIFHEIFLDLGSMFMLSAAYRIVLKGRRAHWYRRAFPAVWTCNIYPAGSHLSQWKKTEDWISLHRSVPPSLPAAVRLQQPALNALVNCLFSRPWHQNVLTGIVFIITSDARFTETYFKKLLNPHYSVIRYNLWLRLDHMLVSCIFIDLFINKFIFYFLFYLFIYFLLSFPHSRKVKLFPKWDKNRTIS